MRKLSNDRICVLMSIALLIYIIYYVFYSSKRHMLTEDDIEERNAYLHALNNSIPLIENTHLCSSQQIDLLIVIITASGNFLERQAIRETWGSMPNMFDVRSRRLFAFGYYPHGNFYKDVTKEATHEKDILYLTTKDHDFTLKEIHTYQWLDRYCSNVTYIFKTEDDLFVNVLLLHEIIRELQTDPDDVYNRYLYSTQIDSLFLAKSTDDGKKFLFGLAYSAGSPERNLTHSPYYVSREEYAPDLYPGYCSGFGYLINSATRSALTTEASKDKHPFRFADVYITGIIAQRLNFACQLIPFGFYQGSVDTCAGLIKNTTMKNPPPGISPLLTCSTGRHLGHHAFSDYYRLWIELKQMYRDRLNPTDSE
ncbi:hypothetical protein I4U23_030881 [Adineta vaga]|nr:hypothetical protein I4U23_030881 [Adineta vaga]